MVDKKTGAFLEEQLVMLEHPDQFTPVQGSVIVDHNPWPVGRYHLSGDSIEPGEYGRPSFRLKIGKLIEAKKASA
jgi:hypothetical protein